MAALIPLLALDQPGDQVLAWLSPQLAAEGFGVVQTFDLQVARGAHHECTCPHHGTDQCDCQMVVLLIYGNGGNPAALVLHSQDGRTWLSIADAVAQGGSHNLDTTVRRILLPHIPAPPAPPAPSEAANEDRSAG